MLLFNFNLLAHLFNFSGEVASLLLHLHDHATLHGDFLMSFSLLPEVEGFSLDLLPSFDDHALQVLIQHDTVPLLNTLPLIKVFRYLPVDHSFNGVKALFAAGAHSYLRHLLDVLV